MLIAFRTFSNEKHLKITSYWAISCTTYFVPVPWVNDMETSTMISIEDNSQDFQKAVLNILEDFETEKKQLEQSQYAFLNILEDNDEERKQLQQSQRAFLNILEDMDVEKNKLEIEISARKHTEERLKQANMELDNFAYAASHDLKAPLRVIANASQWLEEDLTEHLTDETRENMALLRGRVKRMEKLLDDLLEYSRIGRKEDERFLESVQGDALMNNIIELLSPPQNFIVTVGKDFSKITVKRMPLQQILLNLISNAIKHHDKKEGHIDTMVEVGDQYYTFSVKDDGPGIASQFHEQIFQLFQTLKPRDQVEGSGMGLAMVKKYVERVGGKLHLESSEGHGSTFSFTWPINR
ncbi:MAG: hypothetical protein A3E82_08560 [Gammaproteobacteria bacterium RIFCSPHIGHO2_12_FULL_38_11]|nr:MAG: hypothetical protein A3E82_08560 [Gammaproteobacteria bacterium RIFCSPHIGHO2_12_FULL_38_11]